MNHEKFFILVVVISFVFAVNVVSAAEFNTTVDSLESDLISDENLIEISENNCISQDYSQDIIPSENINEDSNSQSNEFLSNSNDYTIYIGKNTTKDGDGSLENPFATFKLACNDLNDGKSNVIINVDEGIYYIDSPLIFNVNNLHIIGVSENVCIKYRESSQLQYFTLSSSNGNFTMTNIVVDVSSKPDVNAGGNFKFNIYRGDANLVTFNNCTFKNFLELLPYELDEFDNSLLTEPYVFNNCKFIYDKQAKTYYMIGLADRDVSFNNCIFDFEYNYLNPGMDSLTFSAGYSGKLTGHNTLFNDCWFGLNALPSVFRDNGQEDEGYEINRYAIFSISENYLGNNTYEIRGKLLWNDSTVDGIENLNPMNVTLKVDKGGELNQTTAILKNGTFKVKYTSTSSDNKITATLDNQPASVEFQSINISLDSPIITYGDKQNITVTLPKQYNGIITVTVNNKTYSKELNYEDVITVDITDVLNAETWDVNVTFIDNETPSAHTYGFNTTTITVNKVSNYDFDATITPNTVYIGENATVTLSLPDGATGSVTIKVGENEAKTFNINDTIIINAFVTGDNVVNITFNGDNYKSQSVEKHVLASTKPTTITATNVTTDYKVAKDLVVTLTSNNEVLANKTINVVVGSINENFTTDVDGKVSIDVSNLDPNTYVATISFAGDELYNSSSTTATVVVREDVKTDVTIPVLTAGKAATTTIKLPEKATGNITLSVDGKIISVVNLTNGSATITIPELTAGKHDVLISYSGDGNYAGFSQNSTVTVKEQAKPTPAPATVKKAKQATKIVAKKKTFKAKTKVKKYTITLKTKAGKAVKKVQVTIKIGKKTFKAKTNSKGKATFKIKKLTKKGKYTATIKFKGNANYKAATKKVKITIKK